MKSQSKTKVQPNFKVAKIQSEKVSAIYNWKENKSKSERKKQRNQGTLGKRLIGKEYGEHNRGWKKLAVTNRHTVLSPGAPLAASTTKQSPKHCYFSPSAHRRIAKGFVFHGQRWGESCTDYAGNVLARKHMEAPWTNCEHNYSHLCRSLLGHRVYFQMKISLSQALRQVPSNLMRVFTAAGWEVWKSFEKIGFVFFYNKHWKYFDEL